MIGMPSYSTSEYLNLNVLFKSTYLILFLNNFIKIKIIFDTKLKYIDQILTSDLDFKVLRLGRIRTSLKSSLILSSILGIFDCLTK